LVGSGLTRDVEKAVLLSDRVVMATTGPGSRIEGDVPFSPTWLEALDRVS
jgi:ABC-type nitrate/sulfonate/bicarbonate transport system ATPase subunit